MTHTLHRFCRRPLVLGLALLLCLAACGEENYTERLSPGTPLIAGFESYATRAQALARLPRGAAVKVVEDSALKPGDKRPPFSIYRVAVAGYTVCGQVGELHLEFFNDRLLGTWFFPGDAPACHAALAAAGQRVPGVSGNTMRVAAIDFFDRHYLMWEDARLREQIDHWIKKYS